MLVLEGVVVGAVQLIKQPGSGGRGRDLARTGTVLISRPTIDSAPGTSVGRPDTAVPKATSSWPVSHISSWAQPTCNTVLTVV